MHNLDPSILLPIAYRIVGCSGACNSPTLGVDRDKANEERGIGYCIKIFVWNTSELSVKYCPKWGLEWQQAVMSARDSVVHFHVQEKSSMKSSTRTPWWIQLHHLFCMWQIPSLIVTSVLRACQMCNVGHDDKQATGCLVQIALQNTKSPSGANSQMSNVPSISGPNIHLPDLPLLFDICAEASPLCAGA